MSEENSTSLIHSYCKMCVGPACGILVKVRNGVATEIQGDPEHLANQGKLCPRGNASLFNLYNPYRIKTPLKRTNPQKGLDIDPGWQPISWDEALDIVTSKLSKILHQDPRKLIFLSGFGSMPDNVPLSKPVFATAFGTPNLITSNGPLCPVHFGPLSYLGSYTASIDITRINYLVCIGHSPGGDFTKASCMARLHGVTTEGLQNALDRGLKLVVVNPHAGSETKRGEWVPILPGTDLALLLALGHVILHEIKKYDEWFLRVRTNAPYLIRQDGTYARDPQTRKPLVWDRTSNQAVPFDAPNIKNGRLSDPGLGDAALEGSYVFNGEQVRPAFEAIKDHLQPCTPEWAAGLTTISAFTIRRIARELVEAARIGSTISINGVLFPYRPAGIFCGRGAISHRGGNNVMMAANLINGLLGNTDVPGGITGECFAPLLKPGPDGTVEPDPRLTVEVNEWTGTPFKLPPDHVDLSEFYPHKHSTPYVAWRAILDPKKYHLDYLPEAMLVFGANPVTNNSNNAEVISALKRIPFIVSISYHLDEMTQFADVVLAESANLERLNYNEYQAFGPEAGKRGLQGVNFRYPVIQPLYETRDSSSIFLELIYRLNIHQPALRMLNKVLQLDQTAYELDPLKRYRWEEIVDHLLKSRFGEDKGVDYFKAHGSAWTTNWLPEEKTYNYYYFPDGQTRHAIYNERLLETGKSVQEACIKNRITIPGWDMPAYLAFFQALPHWLPHPEHQADAEYDLSTVNWKIGTRVFGLGGIEELAPVREMQACYSPGINSVWLNAETARRKGLQDGDRVMIESQSGGKIQGTVKTTQLLHPRAVGFISNFGRPALLLGKPAKAGINYNQLLSAADGQFDPVTGAIDIVVAVKIKKSKEVGFCTLASLSI